MELKDLDNDIKSGNIKRVYFFFGEETFLLENRIKSIMKRLGILNSDSMNFSKFDGIKSSFEDFAEEISSYPFGAEKKLVLLKITGWLSNEKSKEYKAFKEAASQISDYVCLIVQEDNFDKKKIKNAEFLESLGGILNFEHLTVNRLVVWLEKFFEDKGKRISTSDINYIINCCGQSMGKIYSEAQKLVLYSGENEKISSNAVRALVVKSNEYKIYELFDDIVEAKNQNAIKKTKQLLAAKEKPTAVLAGITGRLSELFSVKLLASEGMPSREISTYLDFPRPDFAIKKMITQSKRYGEKYLKRMIKRGTELDAAIKSGRIAGDAAVELFVSELVK